MANRFGVLALAALVSLPAAAEKKTVVLSTGDCADPSLVSAAKDFRDAASKLLRDQLMEGDVVLDIVRPRATRSLADLERQIDSARTLFYGGQADRASELVDRALEELERASPESKPWNATVNALVLKALIAKGAEHTKDMNDAFRRIARIDINYKLDPDAYPPSAVSAFEAVKKEVVRTRKYPVLLRPETGTATVFVDGFSLGPSPVNAMLLPGSYRVAMVQGAAVSFPHRIEIPRDLKLSVDLAFEGSIGLQPPLCLNGGSEASAVKLAQLVAAERVVLVRNVAKKGEPPFLSGSVFDLASGKQEREGSVQPELISNLATFLITGKDAQGVQRKEPPVVIAAPAKKDPEPVAKKDPDPVARDPDVPPPPPPPMVTTSASTSPNPRTISAVLIGVGAAAIAAGIIVYAADGCADRGDHIPCDRPRLAAIAPLGKLPASASMVGMEAMRLLAAVDANRSATLGLIFGGIGLAAAGIVGLVLFPSAPAQVAFTPTRDGALLGLSGRF
ncbi:MAG: hypothetical protein QM817_02155 [Archangium sp.]